MSLGVHHIQMIGYNLSVVKQISTFEMLRAKECAPTLYPSAIFTFGFAIESIKEFGSASHSNENLIFPP